MIYTKLTFVEHENFNEDITYYFPDGTNQPPGADWLKD